MIPHWLPNHLKFKLKGVSSQLDLMCVHTEHGGELCEDDCVHVEYFNLTEKFSAHSGVL